MSGSDTVLSNVNTDCGPLILGGLFAFALSGCVSMQFLEYWQARTQMERWKFLVIAIWLLDLCHSAFVAVAIWDAVIIPYGNLALTDVIPWSVGPTVELTAIITFLVQNYFGYRIYRLQKNKLTVAGLVFVFAFARLGAASVTMSEMMILKSYSKFGRPFPSWVFTLGLSLSAFVDVLITTSLCYFLRSNRSMMKSTNRIIDILTVWTLQNGSATCLGAIITLICWLAMPQNRIFLGIYFAVEKLYANSFLATLNARAKFSRKYTEQNQLQQLAGYPENIFVGSDEEYGFASPIMTDRSAAQSVNLKHTQSSIEVRVSRTVEAKYDRKVGMDAMSVIEESGRRSGEPGSV